MYGWTSLTVVCAPPARQVSAEYVRGLSDHPVRVVLCRGTYDHVFHPDMIDHVKTQLPILGRRIAF
ncbi:MAG: hypothetical protein EWM72_00404 [Nitrospira sp.]|nr:MAG: hypothetical protein EWM72_00404 [Nitrospira sp.]